MQINEWVLVFVNFLRYHLYIYIYIHIISRISEGGCRANLLWRRANVSVISKASDDDARIEEARWYPRIGVSIPNPQRPLLLPKRTDDDNVFFTLPEHDRRYRCANESIIDLDDDDTRNLFFVVHIMVFLIISFLTNVSSIYLRSGKCIIRYYHMKNLN